MNTPTSDPALDTGTAQKPVQEQAPRPPVRTDDSLNNTQSHTGGKIQKRGKGRPKGSKNKSTLLREAMADKFTGIAIRGKNGEKVFQKLFELAQEGDMQAIKLVVDKFVPNAGHDTEQKVKDFGIQIVINDMKPEKVIEHGLSEEEKTG